VGWQRGMCRRIVGSLDTVFRSCSRGCQEFRVDCSSKRMPECIGVGWRENDEVNYEILPRYTPVLDRG
jgi:hypothetical protein